MDVVFKPITSDQEWAWIAERANPVLTSDTKGIVAYDMDTEDIVAMVSFDNWTYNSVQLHLAIEKPMILRHGMLEEIADYVYTQAERDIILAVIPANNEKSLKLVKNIGLEAVYTVQDGYAKGVDYILLELRKENCRWLKDKKVH